MIIRWLRERWCIIVVRGTSMSPTLHDGDWLVIRIGRRPRPGDLVVFRARAVVPEADLNWMVKRVVRIEPGGGVYVRGDAHRTQDSRHFGPVPGEAVLGVAIGGRPIRHRHRAASTPRAG